MTQNIRGKDSSLPTDKTPTDKATPSRGPTSAGPYEWPWQFDRFFPGMSDFMTAFAARREPPPAAPISHAPGASEPIEPPPSVDRLVQTALGKTTFSISPVSLALAYFDWATHLAMSPGKQAALVEKGARKMARFAVHAMRALADPAETCCIEPLAQDRRFDHPAWQQLPYRFIYESFLLTQQWWHNATTGVHGVSRHHEQVVSFAARQILDIVSPANFVAANPEVLAVTIEQGGKNLVQGAVNLIEDWERAVAGRAPVGSEIFQPGERVALTPGAIVYRNPLIELIQYKPATSEVQAEPVLIVPAPIMKYYILDLSPQNSLVKYLVDRGHTVFMMSWHNPGPDDRDLGMADYLSLGIMPAIEAIKTIVPERKINAVGYCLGGTIAYEMAQILHRQGEEVPLVAMLDTYNYSLALRVSFRSFLYQKAKFHLANMSKLRPSQMFAYLREKVRLGVGGELANLKTSMPGSSCVDGVSRATSGAEAAVQTTNDYAAEHYNPAPYPGVVTLFKPRFNYKFYPDPNMGWGDLADELDIVEVTVNPHSMLLEPYVKVLATHLRERIGSRSVDDGSERQDSDLMENVTA